MFENDNRFKEAVSHFGEKASYQWLGLNGDEWINQSNKTIDVDFLSDLKKGNIRNIKYQSVPKPIRITETLLGKLGFQFTPEGDDAYEQIWRSEEGFEVWEHSKGFSCDLMDGDVKSLHQLQNLHFFLTQKELYIK